MTRILITSVNLLLPRCLVAVRQGKRRWKDSFRTFMEPAGAPNPIAEIEGSSAHQRPGEILVGSGEGPWATRQARLFEQAPGFIIMVGRLMSSSSSMMPTEPPLTVLAGSGSPSARPSEHHRTELLRIA